MLYPEYVYSKKYNPTPIVKPLLPNQQDVKPVHLDRFQKFGVHLGPKRPVLSASVQRKQHLRNQNGRCDTEPEQASKMAEPPLSARVLSARRSN